MHQAILPALLACNVLSMDVYRRSRTVVYLNADIHEGRERGINVYILLKTDILTSAFRHWCSIYKWCTEIEVWNKEFLHTYSYAKYLPSNSVVSLGEILLKIKDLSKRMLEFYFFFCCKLEPLSQSCSFLNDRLQLIFPQITNTSLLCCSDWMGWFFWKISHWNFLQPKPWEHGIL